MGRRPLAWVNHHLGFAFHHSQNYITPISLFLELKPHKDLLILESFDDTFQDADLFPFRCNIITTNQFSLMLWLRSCFISWFKKGCASKRILFFMTTIEHYPASISLFLDLSIIRVYSFHHSHTLAHTLMRFGHQMSHDYHWSGINFI